MHKAVSPEETVAEVRDKCTGAKWGCVECKKVMFDNFDRELVPLRVRRAELVDKPSLVRDALAEGAAKAKALADVTMTEVRSALGLGSR
jgi:tryptophanyl-tRNA synthetase